MASTRASSKRKRNAAEAGEDQQEASKPVPKTGPEALAKVTLDDVKAFVKRGKSLEEILQTIHKQIIQPFASQETKTLPLDSFYLQMLQDGDAIHLTPDSFDFMVLRAVNPPTLILKTKNHQPQNKVEDQKSRIYLTVTRHGHKDLEFKISPESSMAKVFNAVAEQTGLCRDSLRLFFEDVRISPYVKAWSIGFSEHDDNVLELGVEQVAGKPVIYLLPPKPLESVQVKLDLIPQWHFSAVYPLNKIKTTSNGAQSIEWNVSAAPDGTLVNKEDQGEISYLYWEAEALVNPRASPILPFDPSCVSLTPQNAALLPFAQIVPHLQKALKALSLDVKARTSFITYWLPELMRSEHQPVAFRFIPQSEYEQAAPLSVEPKPDVTTRVFWVFKGVSNNEAASEEWEEAKERASTINWCSVIGIDARAFDASVFRVLEWGGMRLV